MTRRSRKSLRLVATGLAITTVAISLLFPVGVGALDLERNCSDGLGIVDSAACSFNVATPTGHQMVSQAAENENVFVPRQGMIQGQANVPVSVNSADQSSVQRNLRSSAEIDVKSGDSEAVGHYGVADLSGLTQVAVAGPIGGQDVRSDTGNANTTVGGDTFGGIADSSASQTSRADISGGFALAAGLGWAGDGGDGGRADGGDGGDINRSGNSGWAVDATIGLAAARGGDAEAEGAEGGNATTGAGGAISSGSGAAATGGAGATGGANTITSTARNVGDNPTATATGTATSGPATVGDTFGHEVVGGLTGGNTTVASMTGGTATNLLGVTFTQSGDVSSDSGAVTNSGAASASTAATNTQNANPPVTQSVNQPVVTGTNSAPNTQNANSTQTATPAQTVSSADQNSWSRSRTELEAKIALND